MFSGSFILTNKHYSPTINLYVRIRIGHHQYLQTGISFGHIPSPFHFQIQLFQLYIDLRIMRVGKLRKLAFCYLLQPNSFQHFSSPPFVTSSSLPQLLQPIHQLLHRYTYVCVSHILPVAKLICSHPPKL